MSDVARQVDRLHARARELHRHADALAQWCGLVEVEVAVGDEPEDGVCFEVTTDAPLAWACVDVEDKWRRRMERRL